MSTDGLETRPGAAAMAVVTGLCLWLASAGVLAAAAIQATEEIPEDQLLDVAIEVFDPGLPDLATATPKQMRDVYPDLRRSEARYLAMRLKETLEGTGHWGAVRVVPAGTGSVDLIVSGEIRESSGLDLVVTIRAVDASGREWFDKKYRNEATYLDYSEEELAVEDPHQALYDEIANALLAEKRKLQPEEFAELRQIAELRFAADLVPTLFGDYLEVNGRGTRYTLKRLPSSDDPMMTRVARIRERDYMLVDTLNEYYGEFQTSMEEPYDNWRSFSFEEQQALAELRRQARLRKILGALAIFGAVVMDPDNTAEGVARDAALIGGIAAIESGIAKGREAKIHREALSELSASFESEVAPLIVEVEGELVRLSGSREDQYAEWRRLLRDLYLSETGLSANPNTISSLASGDSTNP